MTSHGDRKQPEWRDFEQLVARIEADAVGLGLTVTSPDRVRCQLTGKLREVDASVRGPAGSKGALVTIECRRRRARQDVTWIEQLAGKKQSIGAARTIAVSSSGFSAAAYTVARSRGIELRTMQEVSLADINPLGQLDFVLFWHKRASVVGLGLRVFRFHDWKPARGDVDIVLPPDTDVFAPIFRNVEEGHSWSINDIWLQVQAVTDPFAGVAKGEGPVMRTACFPYPGNVSVDTPTGSHILGDVLLRVGLSLEVEQVSLEQATKVEYASPEGAKLQRVEFASSRPEAGGWRISLQAPKSATDLCELKTGGNWPSRKS